MTAESDSIHLDDSLRMGRLSILLAILKEKAVFQYVLLGSITLVGALLRFYKLGDWSFWIDEIYTIQRTVIHFNELTAVFRNLPSTLWLPISFILTHFSLEIFGINEWSARLASAFIGIVSIPILYFAIRRLLGTGEALITSILLAVAPWHIFWSQNARFYSSLLLLYTLAAFVIYLAIEQNRPRNIIVFYLLLYFALSERLIAVFILPIVMLYLAMLWMLNFEKPAGFNRKFLLFFILPIFLVLMSEIVRYSLTGESLTTYAINVFAGQQFENPPRLLAAISFNIGLPVFALGLIGGLFLVLQKNRLGLFLLISTLLPIALIIFLNPLSFTKDRYVFMTLPAWLCMVAVAVKVLVAQTKGYGKLVALGVLGVLLFDAFGSSLLYYHVNNGNRNNWKAAFELVKDRSLEGDNYVAWWPEFGPFYLEREIMPWKDITPGFVTASGNRFWFVIDSETVWGNIPMMNWLQKNGELIDILYLRLPEDDFNLKIYLYDPANSSAHRN
jgi:mannosyltransferase